jgi:His-Xaa-Ser system radical SAM maturase HxsC
LGKDLAMLTLSGRYTELTDQGLQQLTIARLSEHMALPMPLRKKQGYIIRKSQTEIPVGFGFYVAIDIGPEISEKLAVTAPIIVLPEPYGYLADGDVIRFDANKKSLRVLYRRNSPTNSFLVTERCNHYCLMCSQPPKNVDDSWIVDEILQTIPLIDPATREIGFTGGEPTLLGDRFIGILKACKNYLPNTSIHILSNGRTFADFTYAQKYAATDHHDMMVGIPLYSDISSIHNYVVQAENAFDETIRGILNLKRLNQLVEIRVVLHKQTYARLPQLAEFIARNLTFVDHVALMGLENMGFTKANMGDLWVDPVDYQKELYAAATLLDSYRIRTSIYNHQLCVLDRRLWPFARKSISDWKNEYLPECTGCKEMPNCGGFFSSTITKHSDFIRAIQ